MAGKFLSSDCKDKPSSNRSSSSLLQRSNVYSSTLSNTRSSREVREEFMKKFTNNESEVSDDNDDDDDEDDLDETSNASDRFGDENDDNDDDDKTAAISGGASKHDLKSGAKQHTSGKIHPIPTDDNKPSSISISSNDVEAPSTHPKTKKIAWYILLPHGDIRASWDVYIGILLIYVAAFVPFRVSYLGELTGFLNVLEIAIDSSFGVDMVFNFITAYETVTGELVSSLPLIAKRYIKGYFILDFVATFPFDRIVELIRDSQMISGVNQATKLTRLPKLIKILRIARLLKFLRVYRLQKFIREMELNYNVHQGVSRLFNIVIIIFFATHLVGCLWHAIGVELDIEKSLETCLHESAGEYEMEDDYRGGWVCREGLISTGAGHKYSASIYWAFSTLTTVGYGDISARTIGEQSFSMIMMLLGVSWYAYVVGSMSTVISSFDRQNKQVRLKMLQVNTFIRETKLPTTLGVRIRRYFEYSLLKRKNGLFGYDADKILAELSTQLRTEVITHVESDLIQKIPFFRGKSPTFIANTIQVFQPVVVQEGDFIIQEGSAADEMYFLIKGKAAVFYGPKRVKTMEEGSYFGEIGCILGGIRRAGILAVTTCELQCLSKRNLNLLLGMHPEVGNDQKR